MAFAREGADLVLASRTERELQRVAEQVQLDECQARTVIADASIETDAFRIAQTTPDSNGRSSRT